MKRIEDAPKELQDMFDVLFDETPIILHPEITNHARHLAEHFFLKGFDVAMATNGLPQRPKRTIKEIIKRDGEILGFSSDGKVYRFIWHSQEWYPLPDLPQD